MKRLRYAEEQIIKILKENESGVPVPESKRRHGVAEQFIYRWRSQFAGLKASDAKRLKQ